MSAQTLHVTNGDAVVYLWKKAGLLGTHLAWRDALHEGPVLRDPPLERLSDVRAQFLAGAGFGNPIKIRHEFEKRDATIRRARDFDEVVLWFEHDLFDQLQMLQAVAVLREVGLGPGSVQTIQSGEYLGLLAADELAALLPKRRSLTDVVAESARRAWHALTDSSPQTLRAAAFGSYAGLPFVQAALARLCEEYPQVEGGLDRTRRQILEAVGQGAKSAEEIFRQSQAREEAPFLGNTMFLHKVAQLQAEPAPLLTLLEGGYELTVLGHRVLAGDANYAALAPPDRWIGGVHLTAERYWLWDGRDRTFSEVERA